MKGSRFLAAALPVRTEAEARARIAALRREHPDASHHCWAYRLATAGSEVERTHDAGEPAGTAGGPILQAMRSADLLNVLVVVIRWFGGTRLGKGGLARAYRAAARGALEEAPRRRAVAMTALRLSGPVERDGEVRHLLARHAGRVVREDYAVGVVVSLEVEAPAANVPGLSDDLETITRGTWGLERIG